MMLGQLDQPRPARLRDLGDWTDRIAKGELPHAKPPRPQGVERNIVVTLRDWMNEKQYLHDLIASDRRYPTVNAYGPLYGSPEYSSDMLPILDPVKNTATTFAAPVRDPEMPLSLGPGHAAGLDPLLPSAYWGEERIWDTRVNNHNSMFDETGALWLAARDPRRRQPGVLQAGLGPSVGQGVSAGAHRTASSRCSIRRRRSTRSSTPASARIICSSATTPTTRCGPAAAGRWSAGSTRRCSTRPATPRSRRAGRRCARHQRQRQARRVRRARTSRSIRRKDKRINAGFYAVMPSPVDGSIWGSLRGVPGAVVRIVPGSNPPETALAEVYNVPLPGFGVRGADIDKQGRGVGVAGERPHGQLRSAQVQGPAERPEGDRRPLPGRLGVPPVSGPGLQGHRREQRRVELLHLGRPAQHVRARRGRADVDRQPERRPDRARRTAR